MEDLLKKMWELLATFGLNIVAAIAILIIGRWVAGFIRKVIKKLMTKRKVEQTLVSFAASLVYIGLMAFVIIAALSKLGVETTSLIAIIGAAGLAIGFALQGGLSNFAAGVLLMIFRPFKVGDFIDGGGVAGIVEEIEIFTTLLRTPDNKSIIVPNSKITGDNITNFTARDSRRLDLVFGVGYGDDLDKVKKTIEKVLSEEDRILDDPPTTIGILELADSSVNFAVRPWVKTSEYWDVYFNLNEQMKKRFDKEKIRIPFPQQDVHIFQEKA